MRIPTLAFRTLSLAIGLGLVPSAFSLTVPPMLKASSFGMSAVTLITFGGPSTPGVTARLSGGASPLAAGELLSADIDRLASGVPGSVLGIVSTDVLPLDDAEAVVLSRLYERGVPFLLRMDSQEPDDIKRVSSIFGITPTAGDVILRRDRDGFTQVFSGGASAATTADLLSAVVKPIPATTSLAGNRLTSRSAVATQVSVQQNDDSKPSYPSRRFGLNFVDGDGEISGSSVIDVVRIRTNSADAKAVMVTSSNVTVKTNKNGTVDGTKTQKNLWGAYLPHQYRLSHTLKAENGVTPSYRNHYPLSDDRIEYTTTETRTGGFTIGGSTGSELSATGKADDALAAKMPLNLSASYDYNWSESLSTTFKDYSINSRAVGVDSVEWQALIAPRLRGVLVNRAGAGLPQLTEDKMTSTMRSITFNTQSEWILPGDYEDGLTVSVSGGYDLQRSEWWWERTNLRTRSVQDKRDVPASYVIDMSDPYLTADITVLLRSATGMGECLRDDINVVLVPCDKMDRRQMWGLDPSSRYVNRASGRCLTADSQTRAVVTQSCRISFEQQWQWRADRLHSFIDQAQYRLYVEGGQVRYHAAEGRFQDYPVNPHGTPLEPWTNYPSSPRVGIDHQPAPFGATPRPITPEWASQFRPVSTDQRWHIEVLRQGL